MKQLKSTLVALGLAVGFATTAMAEDMTAYHGRSIDLGPVNGMAYYTIEKDGYHVVATLADADSKAVRFEAVLTPGQTVTLSSPTAKGSASEQIQISRYNDRIHVQKVSATN